MDHNQYTIRHTQYNVNFFWIMVRVYTILILGVATQCNLGIRFRVKCIDMVLTLIMICFRTVLVIYGCAYILKDIYKLLIISWDLCNQNWWTEFDEPFLTNCSFFNAFCCWIIWSFLIVIDYIIMFLGLYLVCQMLIKLVSDGLFQLIVFCV